MVYTKLIKSVNISGELWIYFSSGEVYVYLITFFLLSKEAKTETKIFFAILLQSVVSLSFRGRRHMVFVILLGMYKDRIPSLRI